MKTVIDRKELASLLDAAKKGWEYRNSTNTNYDCWNEEYAGEHLPKLLDALETLLNLANHSVAGDTQEHFEIR